MILETQNRAFDNSQTYLKVLGAFSNAAFARYYS